MSKVTVGSRVYTPDIGHGTVVAMSTQWCIFLVDGLNTEFAVHWDEVRLEDLGPEMAVSAVESIDLPEVPNCEICKKPLNQSDISYYRSQGAPADEFPSCHYDCL